MSILDIKTKEEWKSMLDEIHSETGMVATLTDTDNVRLLVSGDPNKLCAKIRSIAESMSYICQKSHTAMAGEARARREALVDRCEAGIAKFVIPVFDGKEWVGSVTGCGSYVSKEEIEAFVVESNTKLSVKEIEALIDLVPPVDERKVEALVERVHKTLNG